MNRFKLGLVPFVRCYPVQLFLPSETCKACPATDPGSSTLSCAVTAKSCPARSRRHDTEHHLLLCSLCCCIGLLLCANTKLSSPPSLSFTRPFFLLPADTFSERKLKRIVYSGTLTEQPRRTEFKSVPRPTGRQRPEGRPKALGRESGPALGRLRCDP